MVGDRQQAALAVLGVVQGDDAAFEIYVLLLDAEYLALARAGTEGKHHNQV